MVKIISERNKIINNTINKKKSILTSLTNVSLPHVNICHKIIKWVYFVYLTTGGKLCVLTLKVIKVVFFLFSLFLY